MASEWRVWYRLLDGLGEETIDLNACRRYAVSAYRSNREGDGSTGLAYYLAPKGEGKAWVRHTVSDDYDMDDLSAGMVRQDQYWQCRPEQVAHEWIASRGTGCRLPEELEEHRRMGNPAVYRDWAQENGYNVPEIKLEKPRWDLDAKTLIFCGQECKRFTRKAWNQFKVLDAFEMAGWPRSVKNPIKLSGAKMQVKDAINNLNDRMSFIRIAGDARTIRWEPKKVEGLPRG